jgi:hypothetical protein
MQRAAKSELLLLNHTALLAHWHSKEALRSFIGLSMTIMWYHIINKYPKIMLSAVSNVSHIISQMHRLVSITIMPGHPTTKPNNSD